jgi:hypothetical protein
VVSANDLEGKNEPCSSCVRHAERHQTREDELGAVSKASHRDTTRHDTTRHDTFSHKNIAIQQLDYCGRRPESR